MGGDVLRGVQPNMGLLTEGIWSALPIDGPWGYARILHRSNKQLAKAYIQFISNDALFHPAS